MAFQFIFEGFFKLFPKYFQLSAKFQTQIIPVQFFSLKNLYCKFNIHLCVFKLELFSRRALTIHHTVYLCVKIYYESGFLCTKKNG